MIVLFLLLQVVYLAICGTSPNVSHVVLQPSVYDSTTSKLEIKIIGFRVFMSNVVASPQYILRTLHFNTAINKKTYVL